MGRIEGVLSFLVPKNRNIEGILSFLVPKNRKIYFLFWYPKIGHFLYPSFVSDALHTRGKDRPQNSATLSNKVLADLLHIGARDRVDVIPEVESLQR